MRYGVAKTAMGALLKRERPASIHIPYTNILDQHTVALDDGSLLQVIAIRGHNFETEDIDTLNNNAHAFNTLLKSQGLQYGIYSTLIRRRITSLPGGEYPPGFSHDLNEAWQNRFRQKQMRVNEMYLTVIKRNAFYSSSGVNAFLRSLNSGLYDREHERSMRAAMFDLREVVQSFMNHLSDYGTSLLTLHEVESEDGQSTQYESDFCRFISKILNGDDEPFALPPPNEAIGSLVCKKRPYLKHRTIIREGLSDQDVMYSAMLSLKTYPEKTYSGMMNKLLQMPHDLVVTQSFDVISGEKIRRDLKILQGRLDVAQEHQVVQDDVDNALGELASGRVSYGLHHCTIMVTKDTPDELERAVSSIGPLFAAEGLILKREEIGMEAAYWAQLPGNFSYITRDKPINTRNFAGFSAFHNYAQGTLKGNFLGDALTVMPTPGDTPYFHNLHVGELGNTIIVGQTTTGKTTYGAFILSQSRKFNPKQVVLDVGHSWELYVEAENGTYITIEEGFPSNINPLQMPDTLPNRRFLKQHTAMLLRKGLRRDLDRSEMRRVEAAIDHLYDEFTQEERRYGLLKQQLIDKHLEEALEPWVEGGINGWIFDNPTDTLNFDNTITGIDIGWMLEDEDIRTAVTSYLLHRIEKLIDGVTLVQIVLEEGWKLIQDPTFEKQVESWERTIRRQRGMVIFCTQDASSIASTKIGKTIYDQSATKVFFPNPGAPEEVYTKDLSLTSAQFRIIKESKKNSRKIFVKHGDEAVVIVFDLSSLPGPLAVLAGTKQRVARMHELKKQHGNRAEQWLPHLYEDIENAA